ncbi:Protein CBG14575 [Caenorhabditis briggsae]|uniref:Protein CBG14575 n=1 Tax=Caenorhabditis briggsae TaxID=6238 RepID=A8XK81_CAEBR|nr:Protein CBG14575 [Caenorhabditis briggsae]CAP33055.2 Protein CBG14575 [Caenorhabditis briggsae]
MHRPFIRRLLFLFLIIDRLAEAFDVPCAQKLIGSDCLFDEECYGMNSVCRNSRCTCPTNFEEFDIDERTTICRLAPAKIGDSCQRDCKPPLLCRDGKCECWGGSIVDGKCVVPCPAGQQLYGVECTRVAHYMQPCEKDSQCVDPFNSCIAGTCQCAPGTTRDTVRGFCYAGNFYRSLSTHLIFFQSVPTGCILVKRVVGSSSTTLTCLKTPPTLIAVRWAIDVSRMVVHMLVIVVGYGSCDAGASPDSKCRPLTHFCFTVSEPGWKSSLCCPRPCRDPTPLYVNGQCLSIAHRGDPCQIDQQCEGGITMSCTLGSCQCKLGYHEVPNCISTNPVDFLNFQNNDERFPTCTKDCTLEEVVQLGSRCYSNNQCIPSAECRFGTCQCRCGYKQVKDQLLGVRCSNPDDPLSIGSILDRVGDIFGNKRGK